MIDLATVVFAQELDIIQVQAQSIEIYCQDLGIGTIYVLVNDTTAVANQIDPGWWGVMADRVRIVPRHLFATKYSDNGWVSQQVLKLLVSGLSYNYWTMVLDAKTIVTNHMTQELFFANTKQLTLGTMPVAQVFEPAAKIAGNLFDLPITRVAQPAGVPFFFHNATVRQMISHVETVTKESFAEWFQQQGLLTEFVLYSAFVEWQQGLDNVYLGTSQIVLCNNVCHSQVNQFDQKLALAKSSQSYTVGLHRHAWSQLTAEQKSNYVQHLVDLGIIKAKLLA